MLTYAGAATAQQSPASPDSTRSQIRTTLRAFYFNLAHGGWEALTADILAAKIVASRTAPETMMPAEATGDPVACSSPAPALIGHATIALDGDWAEVSVPRCSVASAGADEFRLVRFEERWRFVYIDLYEEPAHVSQNGPSLSQTGSDPGLRLPIHSECNKTLHPD